MLNDCIGHKEGILTLQACLDNVAGLQGKCAFDLPAIIPPTSLVRSHLADIVVYIAELKAVSLLKLTCQFNSHAELSAARKCKQSKPECIHKNCCWPTVNEASSCYGCVLPFHRKYTLLRAILHKLFNFFCLIVFFFCHA